MRIRASATPRSSWTTASAGRKRALRVKNHSQHYQADSYSKRDPYGSLFCYIKLVLSPFEAVENLLAVLHEFDGADVGTLSVVDGLIFHHDGAALDAAGDGHVVAADRKCFENKKNMQKKS